MKPLSDAVVQHLQATSTLPHLPDARYSLLDVLGEGGMGTVYRGFDELLEREVAVKVAPAPGTVAAGALVERLRAEARVLARLEHPGIVPVHDAGTLGDGRVFYVMKRVHGTTLERARERSPGLDRRLGVLERVADAVAFAHRQGVVHRDLKPGNIMVGEFGEVLVLDWGVARVLEAPDPTPSGPAVGGTGGTLAGTVLGTPGFMAPEQAAAGSSDQRADVFALGALLVFLLTGELPSAAAPAHQLLAAAPGLPPPLRALAARCLAADPAARYGDAGEVAEEIRRYRAGARVAAHRERWPERLQRILVTYRTPILLVAAYLVMRIAFALLGRWR
jgi:serine/threonine protein kinase